MRSGLVAAMFVATMTAGCFGSAGDPVTSEADYQSIDDLRVPCDAPCNMTFWIEDAARVSFWVFWDESRAEGPQATLTDPDGISQLLTPGYRAAMILIDDPTPGIYRVESPEPVDVGLNVVSHQEDVHDVLPNLVNLIPSDINRRTPTYEFDDQSIPAGDGCAAAEIAEDRPMRCLRLSNAVGNAGLGNLHVELPYEEGAVGFTGDGRFRQQIEQSDGTVREELVGMATFHRFHQHWHYGGLQDFRLFHFDLDTMTRGDQATIGHKAGFCLEDRAHMDGYNGPFGEQRYSAMNCMLAEPPRDDWYLGVSPGFYDLYWSELSGQYVEISDVPDGIYELVATSIASGILETTPWDNAASVVIDLQGDEIEVLHEYGWYRVSE